MTTTNQVKRKTYACPNCQTVYTSDRVGQPCENGDGTIRELPAEAHVAVAPHGELAGTRN
jgi:hypothetical protein